MGSHEVQLAIAGDIRDRNVGYVWRGERDRRKESAGTVTEP